MKDKRERLEVALGDMTMTAEGYQRWCRGDDDVLKRAVGTTAQLCELTHSHCTVPFTR